MNLPTKQATWLLIAIFFVGSALGFIGAPALNMVHGLAFTVFLPCYVILSLHQIDGVWFGNWILSENAKRWLTVLTSFLLSFLMVGTGRVVVAIWP